MNNNKNNDTINNDESNGKGFYDDVLYDDVLYDNDKSGDNRYLYNKEGLDDGSKDVGRMNNDDGRRR